MRILESSHGAFLIYGKERVNTSLWRRPTGGGPETPALVDDAGRPRVVAQFAFRRPTPTGIVFLMAGQTGPPPAPRTFVLQSFEAKTRRVTPLVTLAAPPAMAGGIAFSPDHRRLLFSQIGAQRSDIVLLQPFR